MSHGSKGFSFTRLFSCDACNAGITAEEKVKNLRDGTVRRYVYYHCTRQLEKLQRLLAVVSKLDSNQQNAFIMPLEQLKSRIILKDDRLIVEKTRKT
ncbi:hypothetical protein A2348_04300 [Candidatus Uhrbacteria bacterium RIFOXYB12_FULL_58_10]|uniref:Recombinase zinc beta ribbon domain-containing protein n=1 Tax=Candidatus Uhrbacteria bacterium RIFOXYB2_FULL_57_15 TaxID=1802422 RepID=A0A1F7W9A3_9BACT|nr:MAG: hypothetical protein A2348_04300 [Candidatus Uhrbacteria bacterium RIFOXYB12_FULL_58_10]OGL98777.1 MAG: hypothetical protein A2304_01200 [Candidatus Uhrbacteria bacterium RIFOXYB2_FULL_57_15]OGL99476.1 MAG: hypothetical protein A2501_04505 [Candidatus Uhrbacteria bacterium RIFOXYC12_FULL_57_11]